MIEAGAKSIRFRYTPSKWAFRLFRALDPLPQLLFKALLVRLAPGRGAFPKSVLHRLFENYLSFDAASAGALLHGLAGDAAAWDGERGLLPSDLLPHVRRLANP